MSPTPAPIPAVPPMHEDMHQKTGWQQQKGQNGKGMGPMFGQQIEPGDYEKRNQDDLASGPTGTGVALSVRAVVHIVHPAFSLPASLIVAKDRLLARLDTKNALPSLI